MSKDQNILSTYDCIGFDLDNTLLEYNVTELSKLTYEILIKFLIERKGYNGSRLSKTFESGLDFVQRGLALDIKKGNIVKLGSGGQVLKACHGTTLMTNEDIIKVYGKEKIWDDGALYANNIFSAWNGSLGENIRCVLDYFDAICVLIFGRLVDTIDESDDQDYSKAWPHILEGLYYMYDKDSFINDTGEFFPALKKDPLRYLKRCPDEIIEWLKTMKENGKTIFLITGSAFDFVSFSASFAFGPNWKDLFSIIVCFARKPGFFNCDRSFLSLNGLEEGDPCEISDATHVVAQGSWNLLKDALVKRSGLAEPKIIYIGDNVVQDVLAPVKYNCCDAAAVCEELNSNDPITGSSAFWGSYFKTETGDDTLWNIFIQKNAKICIPSLNFLINKD